MVNNFNCIFLIFFMILNISLPALFAFLILGKRGAWYKYFMLVSIAFYLTGIISITIIDYIERMGSEFTSIFSCNYYDEEYNLGQSIALYQYSLFYYFLIPLIIGIIFWLIKYSNEKKGL